LLLDSDLVLGLSLSLLLDLLAIDINFELGLSLSGLLHILLLSTVLPPFELVELVELVPLILLSFLLGSTVAEIDVVVSGAIVVPCVLWKSRYEISACLICISYSWNVPAG
jgi:hypothetical protein